MPRAAAQKSSEDFTLDPTLTHPDPREVFGSQRMLVRWPGQAARAAGAAELDEAGVTFSPNPRWPVDVAFAGRSSWLRGHSVERYLSDTFALECVLQGKGRLDVARRHYELLPGDVFVLHPHERHRYCALSDEPFQKMYVGLHWEAKASRDALAAFGLMDVSHIRLGSGDVPRVRELFEALHKAARRECPGAHERASGLAYNLLMVIAQSIPHEGDPPPLPPPIICALRAAVGDAYFIPVYSQMVRAAGCSAEHLNRLFVKHLGMRIHDWIIRRKLIVAVHYLNTTRMKVHEIAARLGYEDPFSFSRVFHRYMGLTPTACRLRHRRRSVRQT